MGTGVWKNGQLEVTFAGAASGVNVYRRTSDGILEGDFIIESEPQQVFERMIAVTNVLEALGSR